MFLNFILFYMFHNKLNTDFNYKIIELSKYVIQNVKEKLNYLNYVVFCQTHSTSI